MTEVKPLNWTPKPGVGLSVVRRGDGGMTLTFTDLSDSTLNDWRGFAMDHLMGSDRRARARSMLVETTGSETVL